MIVIGFYTIDTPYEAEYHALARNLEAFGLAHEFIGIAHRGSWLHNCAAKAEVVRDFISKYPAERLVYMDVDSEVKSRPDLLWTIDADIAAVRFGGIELLSGVVVFNGSRALPVVEKWVELCRKWPERFPAGLLPHYPKGCQAWDQRILDIAIRQTPGVRFAELPPAYNYIHDLSAQKYPGITPVILATAASRRHRGDMDRKPAAATITTTPAAPADVTAQHDGAAGFFRLMRGTGRPTVCGGGSLMETTSEVRAWLPKIIAEHGIRSIADVPCGDAFWMQHVPLNGCGYVGYDLLQDVLALAPKGREYRALNAIEAVPERADLIVCRDFLVHLTYAHALRVLANFRASGARWLAVNTFPRVVNAELAQSHPGWGWRPLNIEAAPFSLSGAVDEVQEVAAGEKWERWMKLYRINP